MTPNSTLFPLILSLGAAALWVVAGLIVGWRGRALRDVDEPTERPARSTEPPDERAARQESGTVIPTEVTELFRALTTKAERVEISLRDGKWVVVQPRWEAAAEQLAGPGVSLTLPEAFIEELQELRRLNERVAELSIDLGRTRIDMRRLSLVVEGRVDEADVDPTIIALNEGIKKARIRLAAAKEAAEEDWTALNEELDEAMVELHREVAENED